MAVFFLLGLTSAASAAIADLEGKSDAARERIERVSQSLNQNRAELDSVQEESAAAAARETELASSLAGGAERAAELAGALSASREELAESKKRLRRAERLLAARLVAMYMSGTPDLVDLALGAEDFGQLASRQEYLVAIQDSDERLAERVRVVRSDLKEQTGELTLAKAEVDAHNAELEAARAGIAAARSAAEASASQLAAVTQSRQSEISTLKSDIAGWQKKIEQAEAVPPAEAEEQVEQQLGGPYSIPTYIVMCESGGNYSALNESSGAGGAYQIMPATWEAYGGKGLPHLASKAEQDRIAALIWAESGASPWVCG